MILILSEEQDTSTDDVINWLIYYKKAFIRINYEDLIEGIYLDSNKIELFFEGKSVNFDEITSFWHRKGNFVHYLLPQIKKISRYKKNYLYQEWNSVKDYLLFKLIEKKSINNLIFGNINKLIVLDTAQKVGLLVPDFYITDNKKTLYNSSIIKSINESYDYSDNNFHHIIFTENMNSIEYDNFFPTFFQKKIEIKYEIRSVFINDKHWSMSIFNNSDTTDYRKIYNDLFYSPLKLPQTIVNKVYLLMNKLQLNYGTVDFIVDKNNRYYFLEINPFGQFGWVSYLCNYNIEMEIAKLL